MNAKYVSLPTPPRSWSADWEVQPRPTCDVWETDRTPQPTGLLDAGGTPIYRTFEAISFGFRGKGTTR